VEVLQLVLGLKRATKLIKFLRMILKLEILPYFSSATDGGHLSIGATGCYGWKPARVCQL